MLLEGVRLNKRDIGTAPIQSEIRVINYPWGP